VSVGDTGKEKSDEVETEVEEDDIDACGIGVDCEEVDIDRIAEDHEEEDSHEGFARLTLVLISTFVLIFFGFGGSGHSLE
jgi:hypothetical protein